MDFFLVSGQHDTGKTEAIYDIGFELTLRGYIDPAGTFTTPKPPAPIPDFTCIMEGTNATGQFRRILLNSATDLPGNIQNLKSFYDANPKVDFIITSCREFNDTMRTRLFSVMNINAVGNTLFEVPRGKITGNFINRPPIITWYQDNLLNAMMRILQTPPYNI